ncbi:MAG: gliding motility-associated C-terminal domain-containing protein [Elusimicrobia bacterium]|nr:gliding motility-associated C-terminal domain-containing protein [Elusimicrobiota bacterium]
MRKIFVIVVGLILLCSFSFAVPSQPTDKSSFKVGAPDGSIPPTPKATYSKPVPTNKWFDSIIYNSDSGFASKRIFIYPQCYLFDLGLNKATCQHEFSRGVLIAYPKLQYNVLSNVDEINVDGAMWGNEQYPDNIKISGYNSIANGDFIEDFNPIVDKFSDYSATIKWQNTNKTKTMTVTLGQGSVFTFFEVKSVYPAIEFPYRWEESGHVHLYKPDGTPISYALDIDTGNSDRIILETRFNDGRSVFYGIFVPEGTNFKQCSHGDNFNRIFLDLPSDQKFFSIGLLPSQDIDEAVTDLELYYKYAYNFVTDTKANWEISSSDYSSKTTFNITTTQKRTDVEGQQDGTLFCLLPHQYNNLYSSPDFISGKTFDTLRGTLKLAKGSSFSTKVDFKGIVPFFQYDVTDIETNLSEYLSTDANSVYVSSVSGNPYTAGKVIAKLANLLPVADNLKDTKLQNSITIKLKTLLKDWLTHSSGEESKYFAYDTIWGGLEGVKDDKFYSFNYNDHHFHFGYFIYASAILAMYDTDFAKSYGQMVNLLIKDIANTTRNDSDFPFMRHFDFYESHSWANGMGGGDNRGIDQESSSEAMNAWSAIYLWGLATGNKDYENLGIYLYSNEYEAIKYYYFDIDKNILKSPYNHNSVGRLWAGCVSYDLFFTPMIPQTIKGIQVLPLTPAMTYLAYDKTYLDEFYSAMAGETGNDPSQWYDIWARLVSLYDPVTALSNFNQYKTTAAEEGSSMSFTYHFINFFDKYGTPVFGSYYADTPSYLVLDKDGTKTYCAYNPGNSSTNVKFYNSSGDFLGYLYVPKKSFALTQTLSSSEQTEKVSVYPVPYKPNSSGRYGGDGIYFEGVDEGTNIKIFNVAGEKVFETTVDNTDNTFIWKAKNEAGNNIASGVYFYYIKTSEGKKVKGKLAIER